MKRIMRNVFLLSISLVSTDIYAGLDKDNEFCQAITSYKTEIFRYADPVDRSNMIDSEIIEKLQNTNGFLEFDVLELLYRIDIDNDGYLDNVAIMSERTRNPETRMVVYDDQYKIKEYKGLGFEALSEELSEFNDRYTVAIHKGRPYVVVSDETTGKFLYAEIYDHDKVKLLCQFKIDRTPQH